ncbi:MAG: ABC transporter ATP-binding protein [Microbacteriaceae bacterium]|nr:MAG: ABC transporter ATP-binding protein [Microbacteriaceae bacterium]
MTALKLRGVSKSFGGGLALDRVDLDIPDGARTVIVGPSGSGKSTVLRLIGGFERPDAGAITAGDRILADASRSVPAHSRQIGYVAQDGALFPFLTVAENVMYGVPRAARSPRAVAGLLETVQLDPSLGARQPSELSGGQQQRVALARALARRPDVMLLDEPFSALDTGLRESTSRMVAETLARAGITAVLVTHDQAEALSFADHLAVIRDGRIAQAGPPHELYTRPCDPVTAGFLGDTVTLPASSSNGAASCPLGTVMVSNPELSSASVIMFRPDQLAISACGCGEGNAAVLASDYRGTRCVLTVQFDPPGVDASRPDAVRIPVAGLRDFTVGQRVRVSALTPGVLFTT